MHYLVKAAEWFVGLFQARCEDIRELDGKHRAPGAYAPHRHELAHPPHW